MLCCVKVGEVGIEQKLEPVTHGVETPGALFCFCSETAACAYSSFSLCSIQVTLNTLWGHPKPFTSNLGTLPWPTSTKDSSTPSR